MCLRIQIKTSKYVTGLRLHSATVSLAAKFYPNLRHWPQVSGQNTFLDCMKVGTRAKNLQNRKSQDNSPIIGNHFFHISDQLELICK